MKKQYDAADEYRILMFDRILKLAPITAIGALITFTIARLFGFFSNVNIISLIGFDITCCLYLIPAGILKKRGLLKDGEVYGKYVDTVCIILDVLVILQWNLITYIFPTKSFWGFAPMFLLLTSFMYRTKYVVYEIFALALSITISWVLLPDQLLPVQGPLFGESLILRIVALVLSFIVIYFSTFFAEKFTKTIKKYYKNMEEKNNELEKMGLDVLDFSAEIIEERDSTSGTHVKRMKTYTEILSKQVQESFPEYGLTDEFVQMIVLGSALHDIGKINIPDSILLKPDKLTKEEFDIIKTHTISGSRIIDKLPDSLGNEFKSICKDICMFHHERFDGKGYPSGLNGEEIPISAQIVSVVDCFDALSNDRPYKRAFSKTKSIKMILDGECGEFSENIKQCIKLCKDKLIKE